jgi:hypothetical protein
MFGSRRAVMMWKIQLGSFIFIFGMLTWTISTEKPLWLIVLQAICLGGQLEKLVQTFSKYIK